LPKFFPEFFKMKKAYEIAFGCFVSLAWFWLVVSLLAFVLSTLGGIVNKSQNIEEYWATWGTNIAIGLLLVVVADAAGRIRKAYPDDAGASPIKTDEASTKRI